MIDLYMADLGLMTSDDLDRHHNLLTLQEQAAAEQFLNDSARCQFIVGRGLLRWQASQRCGVEPRDIRLYRSELGKPYVRLDSCDAACLFNISHCPTMVVMAINDCAPVGVDVEALGRPLNIDSLTSLVMTSRERRNYYLLEDHMRSRAFFRTWTLKEAYTKALGVGMSLDFRKLECHFGEAMESFILHLPRELSREATLVKAWQFFLSDRDVVSLAALAPEYASMSVRVHRVCPGHRTEVISVTCCEGVGRYPTCANAAYEAPISFHAAY